MAAEEVAFVAYPAIVGIVAEACYGDPDARAEAEKDGLPDFCDTDESTQRFWRFIATAALNACAHLELVSAGQTLLDAAEAHIFSDECLREREAFRTALAKAKGVR